MLTEPRPRPQSPTMKGKTLTMKTKLNRTIHVAGIALALVLATRER